MKIVLLGPPGAGKGSLAALIKDHYKITHISTGDMFREEMKKGSALGNEVKGLIEKGALVSDEIVTRIIEQKFVADAALAKGYMLDGFPRTVTQAQDLDKILTKVNKPLDFALNMEADSNLILKRLTGRRVCRGCGAVYHMTNKPPLKQGVCDICLGELYQRTDDNETTIRKRLDVYSASTQPIIDFYEQSGRLKRVNGNLETKDLFDALAALVR